MLVGSWLLVATVALIVSIALLIWGLAMTRDVGVKTGVEYLVGRTGTALTTLSPEGIVSVDREQWTAHAEGELIQAGDKVTVTGVDGVVLEVTRRRGHRLEERHA